MTRYLIDTNVFVYARGMDHPLREPCRAVLRAAREGLVVLEASVEMVQEFAHLLLRRTADRSAALEEVEELRSQCKLHPFDEDVLTRATDLLGRYPHLGVRDAVHAATALDAGIDHILSADAAFDTLGELGRADPAAPGSPWLRPGG